MHSILVLATLLSFSFALATPQPTPGGRLSLPRDYTERQEVKRHRASISADLNSEAAHRHRQAADSNPHSGGTISDIAGTTHLTPEAYQKFHLSRANLAEKQKEHFVAMEERYAFKRGEAGVNGDMKSSEGREHDENVRVKKWEVEEARGGVRRVSQDTARRTWDERSKVGGSGLSYPL